MQVFKVFFKVIKKNLPLLSIYMVIFIAISVFMTTSGTNPAATDFTETKSRIAVINHDRDSELVQGLTAFLAQRSEIVQVKDEPEALQDALFFRKAEYILEIPAGFTDAIMSGGKTVLEKTAVPGSTAAMYTDLLIDNYLNTARLYMRNVSGISQAALVEKVDKNLSAEVQVNVQTKANDAAGDSYIASFFNFSAYSILAIFILGVSAFMLVTNKTDLKMRNLCSPLSQNSINMQSFLANMVFAATVCVIVLLCAFFMFGERLFSTNGLLFGINLFVFMLVALSLSFLLGNVVKNRNAQNAAANTVALGMSFLSGVFVPQYLLGSTVKAIASFLPAYWFVRANDMIGSIASFNRGNLWPIIVCYLIQLGFAALLLALAFIITRQKRNKVREMPAQETNGGKN
ncbi:MAG: ABC transporter permease [Bacillota bacterium]